MGEELSRRITSGTPPDTTEPVVGQLKGWQAGSGSIVSKLIGFFFGWNNSLCV
eukprot:NODE_2015_length_467_cov_13.753589_g1936_i0.p3 GENE.NODE_2015_length_467_cov_13.753589_g1936_i0~~NODE_2015_length_467_cov_13.753589_g1936_i0.p3  ORF type:complete len:53 (+),score=12.74 NODE_2015_length_467_cov_13.753589_g1936_i0:190-348(+)